MPNEKVTFKIPDEVKAQSIETLKVDKKILEYLRENDFKIIDDFVRRQNELPGEYKGYIIAYLVFGITS